jgi:transcriptional antiterminator
VQGHTVDEIAEKLGMARRTVHRKLHLIRKILGEETSP